MLITLRNIKLRRVFDIASGFVMIDIPLNIFLALMYAAFRNRPARIAVHTPHKYGFSGKDAYATLYDKNEGAYLMPLYESDIISYEDEETDLYMSYDMISGLCYGSGTILFLVKETSSEFELSVFEGEGTSFSDYDIHAERRVVIPVTVNEQEVSTQP